MFSRSQVYTGTQLHTTTISPSSAPGPEDVHENLYIWMFELFYVLVWALGPCILHQGLAGGSGELRSP